MKAIFPDSKSLQPIPYPSFVHANISGNINSTSGILPGKNVSTPNGSNATTTEIQNTNPKNSSALETYVLGFSITLIIIFVIIFIYKKIKRKRENLFN